MDGGRSPRHSYVYSYMYGRFSLFRCIPPLDILPQVNGRSILFQHSLAFQYYMCMSMPSRRGTEKWKSAQFFRSGLGVNKVYPGVLFANKLIFFLLHESWCAKKTQKLGCQYGVLQELLVSSRPIKKSKSENVEILSKSHIWENISSSE